MGLEPQPFSCRKRLCYCQEAAWISIHRVLYSFIAQVLVSKNIYIILDLYLKGDKGIRMGALSIKYQVINTIEEVA